MGQSLPTPQTIEPSDEMLVLQYDCSVQAIANYIKEGRAKNVVLMVGAGISVSAGIPDFRTPGSGLYSRLEKYNLPNPEDMFNIHFFRENPAPFYDLSTSLLPSNFNPTPMHFFMRLLEMKGMLKRIYTQNIDTLERHAGIDPDLIVEAHGSFGSCHCTICNAAYSFEFFKDKVTTMSDKVLSRDLDDTDTDNTGNSTGGKFIPWCKCEAPDCLGNVKPDIVFFGESLPRRYFDLREEDLQAADLLIVAGTSLKVSPFSHTMHYCNPKAPRILINLEKVGEMNIASMGNGFQFDRPNNYRDVALLDNCDRGIRTLCELIGWRSELEELIATKTGRAVDVSVVDTTSEALKFSQRGYYRTFNFYLTDNVNGEDLGTEDECGSFESEEGDGEGECSDNHSAIMGDRNTFFALSSEICEHVDGDGDGDEYGDSDGSNHNDQIDGLNHKRRKV